jgi:hypothetical protein
LRRAKELLEIARPDLRRREQLREEYRRIEARKRAILERARREPLSERGNVLA